MEQNTTLLAAIETSGSLPSLPQILIKLLDVCNREDSALKDISLIIEKDPSLASRVMRMANSAYYNLPNKAHTVEHAVLLVGINAIKNIAVSASIYQAFNPVKENAVFNFKKFWWHSLMCAVLSKRIAEKTLYALPEEAFLAGLVHDIGKLILWENFSKEYTGVLEFHHHNPHLLLTETEERLLGTTHCDVGAWLINQWNLDSFMEDAVRYHHEPLARIVDALPLVKIVYAAHSLCSGPPDTGEERFRTGEVLFHLSPADTGEIFSQGMEAIKEVARSLDMEVEPPPWVEQSFNEMDMKRQGDLTREAVNMALLQGTLQNIVQTDNRDSLLKVLQQGIQVLFDIHHIFFFLFDPDKEVLVGKRIAGSGQNNGMDNLTLHCREGKSLIVKSLHLDTPLNSFRRQAGDELAIVDRQIIRLLGHEGILCLPMTSHKQYTGVIVLGIDEVSLAGLSKKFKLLTLFSRQAALALCAENTRASGTEKIQNERFEAALALAKKVGHEANNPLSIIKNYLKILEMKLKTEHSGHDEIRIINEEIDRVASIIGDLSDLSKRREKQNRLLDINSLLTDITALSRESMMQHFDIRTHLRLERVLPRISADGDSLKQAFLNLIKNAGEAMPEGGNIFISTSHHLNHRHAPGNGENSGTSGYIEVIIQDDGPGIPDSVKPRLFEPFITSGGNGNRGMGLSIVYTIIKESQGDITCESDKTGTKFTIVFPAMEKI